MTDVLSPAEQLRRNIRPDKRRELVADFHTQLAAVTDPAQAQELYDTACALAVDVVADANDLAALTGELHRLAFPPDVAADLAAFHRAHALEAQPQHRDALAELTADVAAAETDAEKAEIVAAALVSGAFADDLHAIEAVAALDPTLGQGDHNDFEAVSAQEQALADRVFQQASAPTVPTENRAMAMLERHLAEAEAAETTQGSTDAS